MLSLMKYFREHTEEVYVWESLFFNRLFAILHLSIYTYAEFYATFRI